jgi:site-specific DNA-methyltransferase (adenine-specific)
METSMEQSKDSKTVHVDRVNNLHAFDFLKLLPDDSVNLCLTDVPYGITDEPFDTRLTYDEIKEFSKHLKRVLTSTGSFFTFVNSAVLNDWERGLYSAGFRTIRVGTWLKTNGHQKCAPYPANALEFFVYTTRNAISHDVILPFYMSAHTQTYKKHETHKLPFRKPVSLLRTIVLNHSEPNDLVIDPFAGSGMVGASALLENRRTIINDIDLNRLEIMKTNLQNYKTYASHKPKEAFLKEERRGKGGGTPDEVHDRIVTRAKYATGMKSERRKSTVTKAKTTGKNTAKNQEASAEEQAGKSNKKRVSRAKWSDAQKDKIVEVIIKNNYDTKMDWDGYSEAVRVALGRKRAVPKDKLSRVSSSIVKAIGPVDGSLLSIPSYNSKTIIKNSALGKIAALGKKKRI